MPFTVEDFHDLVRLLERISCECTACSKTLDARFREHDDHEVIPAHAGIQEPYRRSQAALEERPEWREELRRLGLTPALLALPEHIAELRARSERQFQELTVTQHRTEVQGLHS